MNISDVIKRIESLQAMSCMDAKCYAMEGGWAYIVAEDIQKKMKINQLRKFFDSVKHIKVNLKRYSDEDQLDNIREVKQLKYDLFPELAYALARDLITERFYDLVTICLRDKVTSVKDFSAFEKFLSAIVAYYKMHEWKKKGGR